VFCASLLLSLYAILSYRPDDRALRRHTILSLHNGCAERANTGAQHYAPMAIQVTVSLTATAKNATEIEGQDSGIRLGQVPRVQKEAVRDMR
jgi:hypothetical protein